MRLKIGVLGLILLVSAIAFHGLSAEKSPTAQLQIDGQEVNVEIANTPSERETGLMHRKELPENHGMIFTYPNEDQRSFWMKNTYVPLDIIFVDANGTVINIEQADPEPNIKEENLRRYRSEAPAKYVIEVKQGFAEEHNISPGSKVSFGEELVDCCVNSS